ncbi:hypothetical protein [Alteromonas facilis]|uniref:hypothetical protein n=1 Tax=Alteromonas facilis TaxID=2048004 RepID=UPI000C2924FE|nr:hypothetical protein [Alteromonas facilis]
MEVHSHFYHLDILITAVALFFVTKLSFVSVSIKPLLGIVIIITALTIIPVFGFWIAIATFCFMMTRATNAELMDCIWFILFAKLISFGAGFIFGLISVG